MFQRCFFQQLESEPEWWVLQLKPNDKIWLVKEQRFGVVCKWYTKNHIAFIKFKTLDLSGKWNFHLWQTRFDGKGFDFSQILLPVDEEFIVFRCPGQPDLEYRIKKSEISKLIKKLPHYSWKPSIDEMRQQIVQYLKTGIKSYHLNLLKWEP